MIAAPTNRYRSIRLERLITEKRLPEAERLARQMILQDPADGLSWKRLGALLWWQGQADDALPAMQNAARLLPRDAEAHSNLGLALLRRQRREEALECLQRAIGIDPRCAPAHYHLGLTLVAEQRIAEADVSLRTAVELRPDYLTAEVRPVHSDLLFCASHNPEADPAALFAEHRRFGELLEPPLRSEWVPHENLPQPDRPLKVGFVSADFWDHSVAMFLGWVLPPLAERPGLELHAYSNFDFEDRVTGRLRANFSQWHSVSTLSDSAFARQIRDDGIDILIDLGGHTARNRLRTFARKPAPVQVSWLGYPGTTGLSGMDYYLGDRGWLPPERFAHLFTEKLVYLPDRWAFAPHGDAPPVNPLPALTSGRLTFGSFHRFGKISHTSVAMWARLLHALPDSRLLLAAIFDSQRPAMSERFARHGIAADRLMYHNICPMDCYLALHHRVDIALDAHPFGGGTTTMHSLSMGVPTLAMSGVTSFANACAGILTNVGLEGFVAAGPGDLLERALHWSRKLEELAALRAGMRRRLAASSGGQPELIARHLEAALRHMWRRWCRNLPPELFDSASVEE